MTDKREELVRNIALKYRPWSDMDARLALRDVYSLARAETAKEVIEAAMAIAHEYAESTDRGDGDMIADEIAALASRYAETPKEGM